MMSKKIIIFVVLALSLSIVYASESFNVDIQTVDDNIFSDEVGEFRFTISNFDVNQDRFDIFSSDPAWSVYFEKSIVIIEGKKSETVTVILDPTSFVEQGRKYSVPMTVRSFNDQQSVTKSVSLIVNSDTLRTYRPAVFVDAIVGEAGVVDPTQNFDIALRFINRNRLDIESLEITLTSPLINDAITLELPPNEQISKILTYKIDSQTEPQEFVIDLALTANNISLGTVKKIVTTVAPSSPGFTRNVVEDKNQFLRSIYVAELKNNGNVESTEIISFSSSLWERLFTTSNVDAEYEKVDDEYTAKYGVTLQPGETQSISVERNYRLFTGTVVLFILIVVLSVLGYYMFRAPIIISKRIESIDAADDDSVSRIKIILDIKNRTGRLLQNVKVLERVPNITEVDKEFAMGTLKPTKIISNHSKGTLVRWDFASLEPFEERIITYTATSKLSILGELELPATIIKYDSLTGTHTVEEKDLE